MLASPPCPFRTRNLWLLGPTILQLSIAGKKEVPNPIQEKPVQFERALQLRLMSCSRLTFNRYIVR